MILENLIYKKFCFYFLSNLYLKRDKKGFDKNVRKKKRNATGKADIH